MPIEFNSPDDYINYLKDREAAKNDFEFNMSILYDSPETVGSHFRVADMYDDTYNHILGVLHSGSVDSPEELVQLAEVLDAHLEGIQDKRIHILTVYDLNEGQNPTDINTANYKDNYKKITRYVAATNGTAIFVTKGSKLAALEAQIRMQHERTSTAILTSDDEIESYLAERVLF